MCCVAIIRNIVIIISFKLIFLVIAVHFSKSNNIAINVFLISSFNIIMIVNSNSFLISKMYLIIASLPRLNAYAYGVWRRKTPFVRSYWAVSQKRWAPHVYFNIPCGVLTIRQRSFTMRARVHLLLTFCHHKVYKRKTSRDWQALQAVKFGHNM